MINQVGLDFVYEILRNVSTEDVLSVEAHRWSKLRLAETSMQVLL